MKLRILHYNVLSQTLASRTYFPLVDPGHILRWKHRNPRLEQIIRHADADILCLVEVDQFDWWSELLRSNGFEYAHARRPSKKHDSVVIAWRGDKLRLHSAHEVCFDDIADALFHIQPDYHVAPDPRTTQTLREELSEQYTGSAMDSTSNNHICSLSEQKDSHDVTPIDNDRSEKDASLCSNKEASEETKQENTTQESSSRHHTSSQSNKEQSDSTKQSNQVGQQFCMNNVALFAALCSRENDTEGVIVTSTHAYWNPARANVNWAQMETLKLALSDVSNAYPAWPILLGCDLNSLPTAVGYTCIRQTLQRQVYHDIHQDATILGWEAPSLLQLSPGAAGDACALSGFQVDQHFRAITRENRRIAWLKRLRAHLLSLVNDDLHSPLFQDELWSDACLSNPALQYLSPVKPPPKFTQNVDCNCDVHCHNQPCKHCCETSLHTTQCNIADANITSDPVTSGVCDSCCNPHESISHSSTHSGRDACNGRDSCNDRGTNNGKGIDNSRDNDTDTHNMHESAVDSNVNSDKDRQTIDTEDKFSSAYALAMRNALWLSESLMPPLCSEIFSDERLQRLADHNANKRNDGATNVPHGTCYDETTFEPEATTWVGDFHGCLDYILFAPALLSVYPRVPEKPNPQFKYTDANKQMHLCNLSLRGCVPLPNRQEACGQGETLPNILHPSDHLPLRAEFELQCNAVVHHEADDVHNSQYEGGER